MNGNSECVTTNEYNNNAFGNGMHEAMKSKSLEEM
jgi:hypothetical protein